MPPKKLDFNALQAKWYDKLAKTGFKDIEHKDGSINSGSPRQLGLNQIRRETIEAYYYMCYHFLNNYEFSNELEKIIWEYHTEGISVRNISSLLNKAKISKMKKDTVWYIVRDLERKMKGMYLSI